MRLWWPNQDYFNLTWDRIRGALPIPAAGRHLADLVQPGLYPICPGDQRVNTHSTLKTWIPGAHPGLHPQRYRLTDMEVWGFSHRSAKPQVDPYESTITLAPSQMIGSAGSQPGQLTSPRGIKVAADGRCMSPIRATTASSTSPPVMSCKSGARLPSEQGRCSRRHLQRALGVAIGRDGSLYVGYLESPHSEI